MVSGLKSVYYQTAVIDPYDKKHCRYIQPDTA